MTLRAGLDGPPAVSVGEFPCPHGPVILTRELKANQGPLSDGVVPTQRHPDRVVDVAFGVGDEAAVDGGKRGHLDHAVGDCL